MKKSLLLSAALIAASSMYAAPVMQRVLPGNDTFSVSSTMAPAMPAQIATRASGTMKFSYAGEPYSALRLNNTTNKTTVYQGFELSVDDAKAFAGNKISAINVVAGVNETTNKNPVSKVTVFITTGVSKFDYTQEATLTTDPFGTTEITLDTPYEVTGDTPLLIGCYYKCPTASKAYYIPIDGVANTTNTMLVATSDDNSIPAADMWQSAAANYGALCMSITLSGDKLPENQANLASVEFPESVSLSDTNNAINVQVRNMASNVISSLEFTVSGEGYEKFVTTVNGLNIPASSLSDNITVSGFKATKQGFNKLTIELTKVNGVAVTSNSASANIACFDGGFSRHVVLEDATGTWCGWCPGGLEMLEYATKTYPDMFIPVGVHYNDAMAINDYSKFLQDYISGFPTVLLNRMYAYTPTSSYDDVCKYVDAANEIFSNSKSYGNVDVKATYSFKEMTDKDGNIYNKPTGITFNGVAEFAMDASVPHGMAFILTENGVGPYTQQNYFRQYGIKMNGWESKSGTVAMKFNDVARVLQSYPAISKSIPTTVKAGEKYNCDVTVPLTNVASDDIYGIVILVNLENGTIVNAKRVKCNAEGVGVDSINANDGISVKGGKGTIEVLGAQNVAIYNLAGVKVSAKANANVPAGIYMVVADGKTTKVVVR